MEKEIKLNLGCYNKKMYDWTNVDIREDVNPDVIDDVFKLEKFKANSVDQIYICHVLEHASFADAWHAVARYYEVLKPGGILRIAVPNIAAVVEHYVYHKNLKDLYSALWGSQRHDYDFHRCGFDEPTLREMLEYSGFTNVSVYDRWKTEHAYVDDYSAAYYPHMNFTHGKLMSLNMQGTKPQPPF
jgi:predicted SAM-dependent methyltransferase